MTEEYKKTLLQYLTGKLSENEGKNEPIISQTKIIENNITEFVKNYYPELTSSWSIRLSVERGDYILLWGFDSPSKKSFIIVLTKQFDPIKYIDKYITGTPLTDLYKLNSDDQGTGNIYGIDMIYDENNQIRRRVVIINDFTLSSFEVRLLNSYNLPQYQGSDIAVSQITKKVDEGKYFIVFNYSTSSGFLDNGGVLEFINNVGSENEWNFFPYSGNKNINWYGWTKGVPIWNDSQLDFTIFCDYEIEKDNRGNTIGFLTLKRSGENCIDDKILPVPEECKNITQLIRCEVNSSEAFVSTASGQGNATTYVIKYDLVSSKYKILYSKEDYIEEENEASFDNINFVMINNQFFFTRWYQDVKMENGQIVEFYQNELYLYQYYDDMVFENLIYDFGQQNLKTYEIIGLNNYNLYSVCFMTENQVIKVSKDFNPFNYNGQSYINTNSLISNSAELYSNDDLVFARNLYNRTLNNNTTISTIEVPNTYLNGIDITSKNLISETNLLLVKDGNVLQKNIYETLFVNFINTIQVVDKNDPTLQVNNRQASIFLNNSINDESAYNNAKIKPQAKITYQDYSTKEIGIGYENIQDTSVDIKFSVQVDKPMQFIEIISNDDSTVYQTIDVSNLETGKYYEITQNLEVV